MLTTKHADSVSKSYNGNNTLCFQVPRNAVFKAITPAIAIILVRL